MIVKTWLFRCWYARMAVLGMLGLLIATTAIAAGPIRVVVWDEQQPAQKAAYDNFLGNWIARYLQTRPGLTVTSVRLADPDQGLPKSLLDECDVLVWWGHVRHGDIRPGLARDIAQRVKEGKLSLIALHSAHWSLPFVECMYERAKEDALKQLSPQERASAKLQLVYPRPYTVPKYDDLLTPSTRYFKKPNGSVEVLLRLPICCFPAYRADGKPSHIRTLLPAHPLAKDIPAQYSLPRTEMYDEPFHVPTPDAVVFEERWEKGEWFRSGSLWQIGKGKVFYFRPGHELYPIYKEKLPLQILENAARWLPNKVAK